MREELRVPDHPWRDRNSRSQAQFWWRLCGRFPIIPGGIATGTGAPPIWSGGPPRFPIIPGGIATPPLRDLSEADWEGSRSSLEGSQPTLEATCDGMFLLVPDHPWRDRNTVTTTRSSTG